jgi:hypothetical protein
MESTLRGWSLDRGSNGEAELEEVAENLRHLSARRDTLASAGVLRRLEAIEHALTQKRTNVSEANKALKQAVSKIVMDTADGTLTFHWHHADQPSEPLPFAWVHGRAPHCGLKSVHLDEVEYFSDNYSSRHSL